MDPLVPGKVPVHSATILFLSHFVVESVCLLLYCIALYMFGLLFHCARLRVPILLIKKTVVLVFFLGGCFINFLYYL